MIYNIIDFGADPTGRTLSTDSLQKAIDTCNENGGGRVLVPAGDFYSGTIYLKDNTELHLEHGANLYASRDISDYNPDDAYPQNADCLSEHWRGKHFIIAHNVKNISITGTGKIIGNGSSYLNEEVIPSPDSYVWMDGTREVKSLDVMRPGQLIAIIESRDIYVSGITIEDGPAWCLFLHGCQQAKITGISVFNDPTHLNTDGIDIDCCRHVTISDCNIKTGDDCIAIRTSSMRLINKIPCEYITISNCNLSSRASAFRIGVGTGHIRHIRVSNITIEKTAFAINYMTGYNGRGMALIDDVNFSSVSVGFCSNPILIQGETGFIKNITIENFRARAIASTRLDPESSCEASTRALPDSKCDIEGVTLKNVDIFVLKEEREVSEEMKNKRGREMLYIGEVKNVLLENFNIHFEKEVLSDWDTVSKITSPDEVKLINCNI